MMKRILLIFTVFLSCSKTDCKDLVFKDGITTLKGDLYSGDCSEYYSNGQIKSIQKYLDGKDHGEWVFYYPAEIIRTRGEFNKGVRVGKWEYFYNNGNPWKIHYYDSIGKRTGKWITYSLDKTIDSIHSYK